MKNPVATKGHLASNKPFLVTKSDDDATRASRELKKRMYGKTKRKTEEPVQLSSPLNWVPAQKKAVP